MIRTHSISNLVVALLALTLLSRIARADVDPVSGIDFVAVGAVGNAAWPGDGTIPPQWDRAIGRGSVNYEYRIGRYEVTTAQWVEFMNACWDRPASDQLQFVGDIPVHWGAVGAPANHPGGRRWQVAPGQEMRMVGGISWRGAAVYCNWLHNNKSLDRSAFLDGAYDVSTFGGLLPVGFSDQLTHHPGARYWIPTYDEWIKAVHYDPNKANPDGTTGGWWVGSNGTNIPLTYAPPPSFGGDGTGQANAGFVLPGFSEVLIPLGSYPTVTTPWGLLDAAGANAEWTERAQFSIGNPFVRVMEGSAAGQSSANASDQIYYFGGSEYPSIGASFMGVRIASSVPAPGLSVIGVGALLLGARRRRTGGFRVQTSIGSCRGGVGGDRV